MPSPARKSARVAAGSSRSLRWIVCTPGLTLAIAAAAAASDGSLAALAEAYRAGHREEAVAEVARRSQESLEREVEELARLSAKRPDWNTTRLGVIGLLTESALLEGRAGRFSDARWRLLSAARLLEAAPPTARGAVFERRFYLLAGLALQAGGDLEPGYTLVQRGLTIDPRDPELLTALGAMIETVATLRQYDRSPDSHARPPGPGSYGTETGTAGCLPNPTLAEAGARYQEALALAPHLDEARLRLGRVRLLRGKTLEALPELDRVAAQAHEPAQRYLASLFAGRAWEARGDVRRAAAAYRAADGHVPGGQSALIALGRALDRLGDAAGAQDALERASAGGPKDDPWWDYRVGQPARLDGLLEELRALIP